MINKFFLSAETNETATETSEEGASLPEDDVVEISSDDAATTESFLIEDETLLQHEYITETYAVATTTDLYNLQIKQYNLTLLLCWLLIAIFVIHTIFDSLKFFYRD